MQPVITIQAGQDAVSDEKKVVEISTPRPNSVEKVTLSFMRDILVRLDADIAKKMVERNAYADKIASVEDALSS